MTTALRTNHIQDEYERPVPGASIYVYNADGSLATLTSNGTISIANPLTSDAFGNYSYYALVGSYREDVWFGGKQRWSENNVTVGPLPTGPKGDPGSPGEGYATRVAMAARLAPALFDDVYLTEKGREGKFVVDLASNWTTAIAADTLQGLFVASTADATKVYVRVINGRVNFQWFGAVADDNGSAGTDNLGPWNGAHAALEKLANTSSSAAYHSSLTLYVPTGDYYFSGTANLKLTTLTVEGDGSFYAGPATNFRFPVGCHGIVVNSYNTEAGVYDATAANPASARFRGADFSVVRNIRVLGPSSGSGNYDGIHLNVRALIDRCCTKGWARAGVAIIANASATDATAGNANNWQVIGGRHEYNKVAGLYVEGADANAGWAQGVDCSFNGQYGIYDNSFLGNTYLGCHTEYNGQLNGGYEGTTTNPPSCVSSGGNRYTINIGQAVGASTNAPSGTTANNTWWSYYAAGGVDVQVPAWVSGMALAEGGAYYMKADTAGNVMIGCYVEGGQSPTKGGAATVAIGGFLSYGAFGSMVHLSNNLGSATFNRPQKVLNKTGTNTAQMIFGGTTAGDLIQFANNATKSWQVNVESGLHITDNATGMVPLWISSAETAVNFGRAGVVSGALFSQLQAIGYSSAGRIVDMGTAAPATGDRAQGEIMFNSSATLTAPSRWVCVAGHATTGGTWGADYIYARADPSTGVGYVTGAGAAVTQLTNKSTATPAINKVCGQVTMNNAALAGGAKVSFVVTNSLIAAADTPIVAIASGGTANAYRAEVTAVSAGAGFTVTVENITAGSLSEAPVVNFALIRGVAA